MSVQWTVDAIQEGIDMEGFDYFFRHYLSPSQIGDEEIEEKAREYRRVGEDLRRMLDEKADRET